MGNVIIQKRILAAAALLALLSGCDSQKGGLAASGTAPVAAGLPKPGEASVSAPPSSPIGPSALHDLAVGEKVYRNTCSICHRLGLRGAPRLGDTKDWVLRLAQGNEVLYDHAVKGYRGSKGSMPSRGSNAKLSEDEVKAAVGYMVWYSVPKSHDSFGSHVFSATTKQFTIR
jgi:cytochrome c5